MAKRQDMHEVLIFSPGGKRENPKVRRHYLKWRLQQTPPIPERCDNENCDFNTKPLVWNDRPLKLILDHKSGNPRDNTPQNLRFLCPNCNSQTETLGGANKNRIEEDKDGYTARAKDKISKSYWKFLETATLEIKSSGATLLVGNTEENQPTEDTKD